MPIPSVTVKNVKFHQGHEGEPLAQASIYIDGKKAGFGSDGDWGGESRFEFVSKEERSLMDIDHEAREIVASIKRAVNDGALPHPVSSFDELPARHKFLHEFFIECGKEAINIHEAIGIREKLENRVNDFLREIEWPS